MNESTCQLFRGVLFILEFFELLGDDLLLWLAAAYLWVYWSVVF
ncbi:hypothetical protein N836_18815 [Leptolyngbya sp. Heron Island J]|nr:hypothetical protein [Leptolyngbya sp. Heron Island J]ESA34043.1 hypothetical protein N836_18815 [Leptolyngbya sp. Heron Island J]